MSTQPTPTPSAQALLAGAQQPDASLQTQPSQIGATIPQQAQQSAPRAPGQNAPPAQHGDMWKKILEGALEGLAAGGAQRGGLGASGGFSGAGAGFVGQQRYSQQQQDRTAAQQAAATKAAQDAQAASDRHSLNQANVQLTTSKAVGSNLANQRAGIDMTQDQADIANKNAALIQSVPGAEKLAATNLNDAYKEVGGGAAAGTMMAQGTITAIAGPDGKMTFYRVPKDWMHSPNTQPVEVKTLTGWDSKAHKPTFNTFTIPAGGSTMGAIHSLLNTAADKSATLQQQMDKDMQDNATKRSVAATKAESAGKGGNAAPALNSPEYQGLVDSLGHYKSDPDNLLRYGKAFNTKLQADVIKKYPGWDQTKYKAYAALQKWGTTGKGGDQIQALNTLEAHTKDFQQNMNQLGNLGASFLNTPINKLKASTGNPAIVSTIGRMLAVRTEYMNVLNNNHALQQEDKADAATLMNPNMSPAQWQSAINQINETARLRGSQTNARYRAVFHQDMPNYQPTAAELAERQQQGAKPPIAKGQPPAGATNPVYGADGKTLLGYAVNGKFAPLGGN